MPQAELIGRQERDGRQSTDSGVPGPVTSPAMQRISTSSAPDRADEAEITPNEETMRKHANERVRIADEEAALCYDPLNQEEARPKP